MNDLPDHEAIERVLDTEPKKLLARLPNNTERREAERNLEIVYDLAQAAREKKADRS